MIKLWVLKAADTAYFSAESGSKMLVKVKPRDTISIPNDEDVPVSSRNTRSKTYLDYPARSAGAVLGV